MIRFMSVETDAEVCLIREMLFFVVKSLQLNICLGMFSNFRDKTFVAFYIILEVFYCMIR